MAFNLSPLPYAPTALEPHISARTFEFHHGKHHQAYVNNLNKLLEGQPMADASLTEVVKAVAGDASKAGVFNNAAQVYNHDFFWASMAPTGGGAPKGAVAGHIDSDFGGYDGFVKAFTDAATTQFGSGWAWLVAKNGKLEVRKTPNAETPLTEAGVTPLLTLDVWEHAYYLDYQNRRPDFIKTYLDHLVNWDFANANLARA
jgi:Fe-Mn family superoxide dismutase